MNAFNQHYKFEHLDDVFNIISKEINVDGNICDILEKYFEFLSKSKNNSQKNSIQNLMIIEILVKKKKIYVNKKLNMLQIHKELFILILNKTQTDFDATSLYPTAMWDENSVYPKIETRFAFQPDMNDV